MKVLRRPFVELLYVDGCPSWRATLALVEEAAQDIDVRPKILLRAVVDGDEARRLRFLGSPTVRVDGVDVEPGAEDRSDFAFACRLYRTASGLRAQPRARWVREALDHAGSLNLGGRLAST